MLWYVGKRLLQSIVTLFIIITIVFSLLRLMPEEGYLGAAAEKMSPAQKEVYLTNLGLRNPLLFQLGNFYTDLLQGDLGKSVTYRTDVPVVTILADKIMYSLFFGLGAVGISLLIGVPLGILMAQMKGRWLDRIRNWLYSFCRCSTSSSVLLSYSNVYYRYFPFADVV
ncbi:Peptide ABC transporter permease OS=Lysinibacillus sphaericus OX=1421 GN=LS41612_13760 PE=3 SV=1 [Lysinibacillus sphaericus]